MVEKLHSFWDTIFSVRTVSFREGTLGIIKEPTTMNFYLFLEWLLSQRSWVKQRMGFRKGVGCICLNKLFKSILDIKSSEYTRDEVVWNHVLCSSCFVFIPKIGQNIFQFYMISDVWLNHQQCPFMYIDSVKHVPMFLGALSWILETNKKQLPVLCHLCQCCA